MYHITMKDQNTLEQTEFDFNESGETEQQRLEREVLAAGGRVGKSEGRFIFGLGESEGYRRGDEHPDIEGLYYWNRNKAYAISKWLDWARLVSDRSRELESGKMWVYQNPNKARARSKKYRERNKYKEAERHKKYREENPNKKAEMDKGWRKDNPDKARAQVARRRARKLEALDPSANKAVIESRYAAEEYLNTVTGCDWHVDHTQPLSLGGKEHENNMQVVPAKWNCSKGARHCDRWIEDSDIYRYATAVEAGFEREAKKSEKK